MKPLKESTIRRLSDAQIVQCVKSNHPSARDALEQYKQRVKNRTVRKIEKLIEGIIPEIVDQETRLYALEVELKLCETFPDVR